MDRLETDNEKFEKLFEDDLHSSMDRLETVYNHVITQKKALIYIPVWID